MKAWRDEVDATWLGDRSATCVGYVRPRTHERSVDGATPTSAAASRSE